MDPVPGLAIWQQPGPILHRMQLFGEARGERDLAGRLESVAMLAVGMVPINRMGRGRWRHFTLEMVLLEKWAFSCFNPNDPNRTKLLEAPKVDPISWERADTVCDLLESGLLLDPSKGATHYVIGKLWSREPIDAQRPQWFERPQIESGATRETARVGHHVFAVAA